MRQNLEKGDTNMKSLVEFVSNWYLYGSMTSTVDIWGDAEKQLSARVFVYDILNKKEVYSSESFSTTASASKKYPIRQELTEIFTYPLQPIPTIKKGI